MTDKLSFAYLYCTDNLNRPEKTLIGVFKSMSAAESHLLLVHGEDVPCTGKGRVAQKLNKETGQFWYIEKHVMMSGR